MESIFTHGERQGFTLLYLSDTTCPICDVFWPIMKEAQTQYEGLSAKRVDKQTDPLLAGQLLVFQFPTAILFYQGKEMRRFVGAFAFSEFQGYLADIIERFGGN